MFKKLTTTHCLYLISEETLTLFHELSALHTIEEDVFTPLVLNALDTHAIVLQIWCALNENELKLIFDTDKVMPYACNYYILNLIRTDKKIQQFLKIRGTDQNLKYIVSCYLGYVTLQWVYELMLAHEQGTALSDVNMLRNYFLFFKEENLILKENHPFYYYQKIVTKLMVADFQKTNRFHEHIETAINMTRTYLSTRT